MQTELFGEPASSSASNKSRTREPFGRLDANPDVHSRLLEFSRLCPGEIWEDPKNGHRVGVLDATDAKHLVRLTGDSKPSLLVNDPPYNVAVGNVSTGNLFKQEVPAYMQFSKQWVENCTVVMNKDAHFYVWLGADVRDGFQPLPDFMMMMRDMQQLSPRNFITLRNQRGYGTQKAWITHGMQTKPKRTENLERGKSENIRPGNVWVDVQQVFYRLEENVPGCYAQKPLKAIERILATSSFEGDVVLDCFAHSGTTLVAGERLGRRVLTMDIDPVFAELTIRRLEHYRETGQTGWQWCNPFPEMEEVYDAAATA